MTDGDFGMTDGDSEMTDGDFGMTDGDSEMTDGEPIKNSVDEPRRRTTCQSSQTANRPPHKGKPRNRTPAPPSSIDH